MTDYTNTDWNDAELEFKAVSGQLNVDEAQGIVECFVAAIGNKDSVGDIVAPGAFNASLRRRKPRVVWGHDWNQPIGKVLAIDEVPSSDPRLPAKMKAAGVGGLLARVQFNLRSERGREAFNSVAFFGEDQEWSIGYKTLRAEYDAEHKANVLQEVELFEVSPVLHGANQLTGTISIKAAESGDRVDSFDKSEWPMFDRTFAARIKADHPQIWDAGGNIKGDDQYEILTKIAEQGGKARTEDQIKALELREAWVARHKGDFQLPGVIAQIKWLAIGTRGEDHMKKVVNETIDRRESKNHPEEDSTAMHGPTPRRRVRMQVTPMGSGIIYDGPTQHRFGDTETKYGTADMPSDALVQALSGAVGRPVTLRLVGPAFAIFDMAESGDDVDTFFVAYHSDGTRFMFSPPMELEIEHADSLDDDDDDETGEYSSMGVDGLAPYTGHEMMKGRGRRMMPVAADLTSVLADSEMKSLGSRLARVHRPDLHPGDGNIGPSSRLPQLHEMVEIQKLPGKPLVSIAALQHLADNPDGTFDADRDGWVFEAFPSLKRPATPEEMGQLVGIAKRALASKKASGVKTTDEDKKHLGQILDSVVHDKEGNPRRRLLADLQKYARWRARGVDGKGDEGVGDQALNEALARATRGWGARRAYQRLTGRDENSADLYRPLLVRYIDNELMRIWGKQGKLSSAQQVLLDQQQEVSKQRKRLTQLLKYPEKPGNAEKIATTRKRIAELEKEIDMAKNEAKQQVVTEDEWRMARAEGREHRLVGGTVSRRASHGKRSPKRPIDADTGESATPSDTDRMEAMPGGGNTEAAAIARIAAGPELRRAMDSLSPEERRVVQATYMENLTDADAAERLKMKPATLRSHKLRARKKLQKLLKAKSLLEHLGIITKGANTPYTQAREDEFIADVLAAYAEMGIETKSYDDDELDYLLDAEDEVEVKAYGDDFSVKLSPTEIPLNPTNAIPDTLPQERVTGDILHGYGPRRGNLEKLLRYWRPIMRKPGGFRRCRVILADHPELYPLEPLCAWLHHETTGLWPNEGCHHPGMKNCRTKLKKIVRGSLLSDSDFETRLQNIATGKLTPRVPGGVSLPGIPGKSHLPVGLLSGDLLAQTQAQMVGMHPDEVAAMQMDDDSLMEACAQALKQFIADEPEMVAHLRDTSNWEHVGEDDEGYLVARPLADWSAPGAGGGCGCGGACGGSGGCGGESMKGGCGCGGACGGMKSLLDELDIDVKVGRPLSARNVRRVRDAIDALTALLRETGNEAVEQKTTNLIKAAPHELFELSEFLAPVLEYHGIETEATANGIVVKSLSALSTDAIEALDASLDSFDRRYED